MWWTTPDFHQIDDGRLARERCGREPHQVFDADARRGLQRLEGDEVAVAQMVVRRDGHAIGKAALAQRGLKIGHALVAVVG